MRIIRHTLTQFNAVLSRISICITRCAQTHPHKRTRSKPTLLHEMIGSSSQEHNGPPVLHTITTNDATYQAATRMSTGAQPPIEWVNNAHCWDRRAPQTKGNHTACDQRVGLYIEECNNAFTLMRCQTQSSANEMKTMTHPQAISLERDDR